MSLIEWGKRPHSPPAGIDFPSFPPRNEKALKVVQQKQANEEFWRHAKKCFFRWISRAWVCGKQTDNIINLCWCDGTERPGRKFSNILQASVEVVTLYSHHQLINSLSHKKLADCAPHSEGLQNNYHSDIKLRSIAESSLEANSQSSVKHIVRSQNIRSSCVESFKWIVCTSTDRADLHIHSKPTQRFLWYLCELELVFILKNVHWCISVARWQSNSIEYEIIAILWIKILIRRAETCLSLNCYRRDRHHHLTHKLADDDDDDWSENMQIRLSWNAHEVMTDSPALGFNTLSGFTCARFNQA